MKIDYLKEGSDQCPLVRLYEFTSAEVRQLRRIFESLADGWIERVLLDTVESVDGTRLTFVRSARDRGIVETGSHHFEIKLTADGWRQAADLTEPFCAGSCGYQWLAPQTRGIRLLLSKDGSW